MTGTGLKYSQSFTGDLISLVPGHLKHKDYICMPGLASYAPVNDHRILA